MEGGERPRRIPVLRSAGSVWDAPCRPFPRGFCSQWVFLSCSNTWGPPSAPHPQVKAAAQADCARAERRSALLFLRRTLPTSRPPRILHEKLPAAFPRTSRPPQPHALHGPPLIYASPHGLGDHAGSPGGSLAPRSPQIWTQGLRVDTEQWGPGGLSAQFIGARTGQEADTVTGEQGHPPRASLPPQSLVTPTEPHYPSAADCFFAQEPVEEPGG